MNLEQMIAAMTPEIYASLKQSVEIGKWPNGTSLTQEQRDTCMRAMIAYEHLHDVPQEQRTGYIDRRDRNGVVHGRDPREDEETLKIITATRH